MDKNCWWKIVCLPTFELYVFSVSVSPSHYFRFFFSVSFSSTLTLLQCTRTPKWSKMHPQLNTIRGTCIMCIYLFVLWMKCTRFCSLIVQMARSHPNRKYLHRIISINMCLFCCCQSMAYCIYVFWMDGHAFSCRLSALCVCVFVFIYGAQMYTMVAQW